jgi:hypothetical protein
VVTCRTLASARTTIGSVASPRSTIYDNHSTPTDPRQRISIRQDAYLRRRLQRPEDLPWQGAFAIPVVALGGTCVRGNNGITDSTFTFRYFNTATIVALRLSRTAAHEFRRLFIATGS